MREEENIIFGWGRKRNLELIISIFENDNIFVAIQPRNVPFIVADNIIVGEIEIIWRDRSSI